MYLSLLNVWIGNTNDLITRRFPHSSAIQVLVLINSKWSPFNNQDYSPRFIKKLIENWCTKLLGERAEEILQNIGERNFFIRAQNIENENKNKNNRMWQYKILRASLCKGNKDWRDNSRAREHIYLLSYLTLV